MDTSLTIFPEDKNLTVQVESFLAEKVKPVVIQNSLSRMTLWLSSQTITLISYPSLYSAETQTFSCLQQTCIQNLIQWSIWGLRMKSSNRPHTNVQDRMLVYVILFQARIYCSRRCTCSACAGVKTKGTFILTERHCQQK